MKEWLFNEKFQKKAMSIALYGVIISVIGFITLYNRIEELGIPQSSAYLAIIPGIPCLIFLYFYYTARIPVTRDYIFGEITNISHLGFSIGNLLDEHSTRKILWEKVDRVQFSSENRYIEIYFKAGNIICIRREVENWYELAQQVPPEFKDFDSKYLTKMLRSSRTCPCCGYVAYMIDTCGQCAFYPYDPEIHDEYTNAEAYLKEKQLEYFSTLEKGDPIVFYPEESHEFFRLDRMWKPSVSEEEVLKYSKTNNWGKY